MEAIGKFLNEMRRSDWQDGNIFPQRGYNDVTVYESEQTFHKIISSLYFSAVTELMEVPSEKYELLNKLVAEVEECQQCFEVPTAELLQSLIRDYNGSNNQIRGLKEDYDYLVFIKACMGIQAYFLDCFKKKISGNGEYSVPTNKEESNPNSFTVIKENPIKGVKGLSNYLKISITKAQDILNKQILQQNGIAYRVGRTWHINSEKLDKFLSENPNLLYNRNK